MDVEKTMQFILEQQAQFWAGLQQTREANDAGHAAFQSEQRRLGQHQSQLVETQARQQVMLNDLISVVGQLPAHQKTFAEQTAAAQQRTEEKLQDVTNNLNALIKIVDDLVRRDGQQRV